MALIVEFKVAGNPVQVFVGLQGGSAMEMWQFQPGDRVVFDAMDRVPWGRRQPHEPAAIQQAGALLRSKLAAMPALRAAFVNAFAANRNATCPIYFRIGREPDVEMVPFEAIWDDHNRAFISLDLRWPVARLPADAVEPADPFTMEPVVRIAAVLAAEGENPRRQVEALRQACSSQPGLPVEVVVLTNVPSLIDEVNTWPGWTAEDVPVTTDALIVRLREIQPHLLHIFCHGTADPPRLMISQRNDLAVLDVAVPDLVELAQLDFLAPWLVTLNCCEGATPGDKTVSLASELARSGMPAVVGMRRVIDVSMADGFCADLYCVALARLAQIASVGPRLETLDWAALLHRPRSMLCAVHGTPSAVAGRQKEWTMPVLYLAKPQLQIRGMPTTGLDTDAMKEEIITLGVANSLQANGMSATRADRMRRPALERLYGVAP